MVESTCVWCDEDFTYYPSNSTGRFCSFECYKSFKQSDENPRKIELECAECGDAFYLLPSNTNDGEDFCSRECASEYRTKDDPGFEDGVCPECGQRFGYQSELAEHHRQEHFSGSPKSDSHCPTCGLEFADKRAVAVHHAHNHGESIKETVTKECKTCGAEFTVDKKATRHHKYDFCSPVCSYRWGNGGRGIERVRRILGDVPWREKAYEIRERSGGECEMCGKSAKKHTHDGLQVHHLIPLRCGGTHADWNLVAVCPACHGKAEAKANHLFTRYLWGGEDCLDNRPRDEKGRFVEMGTSTPNSD